MKLPFQKMTVLSLTTRIEWDAALLAVLAEPHKYREITKLQTRTVGFVPAIFDEGSTVEGVGKGCVYLKVRYTEKPIPKALINSKVGAIVARLEKDEDRTVRRPERGEITEKVLLELIPHAFPKDTYTPVILTPEYVFVDSTSGARVEDVLSLLRAAIGTLPVQALRSGIDPVKGMTEFVLNPCEDGPFALGEKFKAKDRSDSAGVLSCSHTELENSSLVELVSDNRDVVELELKYQSPSAHSPTWVTVTKDLILKGISWPVELSDSVLNECGEDDDQITIVRSTLRMLCPCLVELLVEVLELLGGEVLDTKAGRAPAASILENGIVALVESLSENPAAGTQLWQTAAWTLFAEQDPEMSEVLAATLVRGLRKKLVGTVVSVSSPEPVLEPAGDYDDEGLI